MRGPGAAPPPDTYRFHALSINNPVLDIWNSRLSEYGFDATPLAQLDDLNGVPGEATFHFHWTNSVTDDEEEHRRLAEATLGYIEEFVGRGGLFLWTIHEPLPHDCPFPALEKRFRQRLSDLADAIHLLHPSTLEATQPYYRVDPAKTFLVEQPFLVGYPDFVTRAAARRDLGLADDCVLLLAFGAIRPYKGYDRVVRLLPEIRRLTGEDVRLMIAGPVSRQNREYIEMLRGLVAATAGATISTGSVAPRAVQTLLRGADLAVVPYREVHNSGSVMLNMQFGLPTIVPQNPVLTEAAESGMICLFDGASDQDLLEVTVASVVGRDSLPRTLSDDFRSRHDPVAIAAKFGDALRRQVDDIRRKRA